MDPITGGLIGASVASNVIGGLMGAGSARRGREQAASAAAAAFAELEKLGLPPDTSKEIILQHFQSQGMLTPELEQDISLQASQTAQIKEDPSLRAAQADVLNTLRQQSRGGLQAGDRAAYNELRAATQRDAEAKRQQIAQQMQAQGMGGSGASLMAQLQSSQGAADQQSAAADRIAATSSQRGLEALAQLGNQAQSMRSQDFSVNQARAAAEDQRNQFLYANSVAQQQRNLAARNLAQQANLANQQRLSDINIGQANQESLRQNQAKEDFWKNKMNLATAKANALNNQGSVLQQGAQAKANMYSGMGSAVGQGFATGAKYYNQSQQPEVKKKTSSEDEPYDYWS